MDVLRGNQTRPSVSTQDIRRPVTPNHQPTRRRFSRRHKSITAAVVGLVVLGVVAALWLPNLLAAQKINGGTYQVVYLMSGQAYFGKLQNTGGDYLVIKDPYTAQAAPADTANKTAETQTTLIKVSSQVYGPEDSIAIKSDQVAFWQNLRDDSKVTQAIKAKQ